MATTFSVTTPDNRTATRTSKTRTYTHAVAVLEVQTAGWFRTHAAHLQGLVASAQAGSLDGSTSEAAVQYQRAADAYLAAAGDRPDEERVEFGDWWIAGWTSREDLAVKLAAREGRGGFRTQVLEVH